jgi:predicted ATPase/sortase (surface protein transpeptidase)
VRLHQRKHATSRSQPKRQMLWLLGLLVGVLVAAVAATGFASSDSADGRSSPPYGHPSEALILTRPTPVAPVTTPPAPPAGRSPSTSSRASSATAPIEAARTATMPASAPVRLQIPAIGVDSELMDLGLQTDGTLEVPPSGFPAGWYTGAPTPGELGPAIIAGHVDWAGQPGVFFELRELAAGDEILVTRQEGSTATFRVTRVEQFDKDSFPTQAVYGDLDHAGLRLITCGGAFDRQARGWWRTRGITMADAQRVGRSGWRPWAARSRGAAAGPGDVPGCTDRWGCRWRSRPWWVGSGSGPRSPTRRGTRLVTLTGSGGCGKTRLALEVAHDVAPGSSTGPGGWSCRGWAIPTSVAQALADAVGVREEPGRALVDTLIDGCVAGTVWWCWTTVSTWSGPARNWCPSCCARARHLTVLATSREPLAIDGETSWEVPPLTVPDPQARSADAVGAAEAVALFETRARQVRPDFAVTDDNAAAVAQICRRLDGIPLAVELAAARMRVLSVAQIAAGLSDRFRLLTGTVRGAPSRQATLEASVAWSFGLLSDAERLALARLSVFVGTFDLEAAQAVVAGPDIDETQVLDLVTALADRSLLQVGEHDGRARYRLLETIRLFARERLAELDDPARVRDRHLDFFIGLADRAGTGLGGPDAAAWNARLAADLADLRAAMAWAVDSGRPVAVLDIAEPTRRFWFDRSRYAEMERWLRAAVDAPAATDTDRARGLVTASLVIGASGHAATAHAWPTGRSRSHAPSKPDDTLALASSCAPPKACGQGWRAARRSRPTPTRRWRWPNGSRTTTPAPSSWPSPASPPAMDARSGGRGAARADGDGLRGRRGRLHPPSRTHPAGGLPAALRRAGPRPRPHPAGPRLGPADRSTRLGGLRPRAAGRR